LTAGEGRAKELQNLPAIGALEFSGAGLKSSVSLKK
jgi:hypothetical protein